MYTIERRVALSDTAEDGLLSLGGALEMMIDCSYFWQEAEPAFLAALEKNHLGMFLVSRQLDIVRRPAYGEHVSVTTSIYEAKSIYGLRNTLIRDASGMVCYASFAVGAFVDFLTGRPVNLSPEVAASIKLDPRYDGMEYLSRKVTLPAAAEFQSLGSVAIRPWFLDMNHHVDNVRYVIVAQDFLQGSPEFSRVRIDYRAQALPASQKNLVLEQCSLPERRIVRIGDGAGLVNTLVEFS